MPFEQFSLDRSFNQSRGIFDKYIYRSSNDSLADIQQAGYFTKSRFVTDWAKGILEVDASDGYATMRISDDGLSATIIADATTQGPVGPAGTPGQDGLRLEFVSEFERDAYFTANPSDLLNNLPITVTSADGTAIIFQVWSGPDSPSSYTAATDAENWILATGEFGNGSILLGPRFSLSNGVKAVAITLGDGTTALGVNVEYDSTGTSAPFYYKLSAEETINVNTSSDTVLSDPFTFQYTVDRDAITTNFNIIPNEAGKLRARFWIGTDDTGDLVYDESRIFQAGHVGSVQSFDVGNPFIFDNLTELFVRFEGIALRGGAASASDLLPEGTTTIYFTSVSQNFVREDLEPEFFDSYRIVYVSDSTDADDANDGLSIATPVRTMTRAIAIYDGMTGTENKYIECIDSSTLDTGQYEAQASGTRWYLPKATIAGAFSGPTTGKFEAVIGNHTGGITLGSQNRVQILENQSGGNVTIAGVVHAESQLKISHLAGGNLVVNAAATGFLHIEIDEVYDGFVLPSFPSGLTVRGWVGPHWIGLPAPDINYARPVIEQVRSTIDGRHDVGDNINGAQTFYYTVHNAHNISGQLRFNLTASGQSATFFDFDAPTTDGNKTVVFSFTGLPTLLEGTTTYSISGTDSEGSAFSSPTVSIIVSEHEETFWGFSSTNNPATIDTATMTSNEVDASGDTFVMAGTFPANQFLIVLVPATHDLTSITAAAFPNINAITDFTKTDNVRSIGGLSYHSYVVENTGPSGLIDYTAEQE